jgi:hypothetical protein
MRTHGITLAENVAGKAASASQLHERAQAASHAVVNLRAGTLDLINQTKTSAFPSAHDAPSLKLYLKNSERIAIFAQDMVGVRQRMFCTGIPACMFMSCNCETDFSRRLQGLFLRYQALCD